MHASCVSFILLRYAEGVRPGEIVSRKPVKFAWAVHSLVAARHFEITNVTVSILLQPETAAAQLNKL